MKRHYLLAIVVTLVAVEGCAEKQSSVNGPRQVQWKKSDPAVVPTTVTEKERAILPKTHFAAGSLHEQNGAYYKAVSQYRKAVIADPEYVAAWNRLGVASGKLGRLAQAENALEKAVALRPDSALLHNNLGFVYTLGQRWDRAESELRRALDLKSDFSKARINLAMVLAKQDRFEESLESFVSVLPEQDALYNLGLMFRSKNRYRDAAEAFTQALEIDPHFVAAEKQLEDLAPRLVMSGDMEQVLDDAAWSGLARVLWGPMPEPWLQEDRQEALAAAEAEVELPDVNENKNTEQEEVDWNLVVEALTGIVGETDLATQSPKEPEHIKPEAAVVEDTADTESVEEEADVVPVDESSTEAEEATEQVEDVDPVKLPEMADHADSEPTEKVNEEAEPQQPAEDSIEEPDDITEVSNEVGVTASDESMPLAEEGNDAHELEAEGASESTTTEPANQIDSSPVKKPVVANEEVAVVEVIPTDVNDSALVNEKIAKAPMATEPFGELVLAWLEAKPLILDLPNEQPEVCTSVDTPARDNPKTVARKQVAVRHADSGDQMTYESLLGFWQIVWSQYESGKQSMETQEFLATEIDECEEILLAGSDWLTELEQSQEIITLRDLPVFAHPTYPEFEQSATELVAGTETTDKSSTVETAEEEAGSAKEEIMAAMEVQYPPLFIMPNDAESDDSMLFGAAVYNPFAD